jgi:hypothetical protein
VVHCFVENLVTLIPITCSVFSAEKENSRQGSALVLNVTISETEAVRGDARCYLSPARL